MSEHADALLMLLRGPCGNCAAQAQRVAALEARVRELEGGGARPPPPPPPEASAVLADTASDDDDDDDGDAFVSDDAPPWKCRQCPCAFATGDALTAHCRALHAATRETPFQCPLCPRRYASLNAARRHHWNQHSAFTVCPHCDAGFAVYTHFIAHVPLCAAAHH